MNLNLNHYYNKHNKRYLTFISDLSNNNLSLFENDELNIFRDINNLHTSNDIIYSKYDPRLKDNSKIKNYPKLKDNTKIKDRTPLKDRKTLKDKKNLKDKNNLKPFYNNHTMTLKNNNTNNTNNTNNKLITYLDNSNLNNSTISHKETTNVNQDKTDILLQLLLNKTDKEYYKYYNSPFFSGMMDIPKIPSTPSYNDEDIKKMIKEQIIIDDPIDNLSDLIDLCNKFPLADNIEYNINMKSLHNIKPSLIELQNMIGMSSIKENIVDQIIYFIQDLHTISPNNSDYMHTVIYGPPGTGKTEVAKIMGKIFSNLGMLKTNFFKKVTRDDLIAGFLGQTAIKTKEVITECIGGVLFIDEAYALGNKEKKDSFSKECIDTICEALSDHKHDIMCIIAGYEEEIKDCFFSYNTGLESRFTWKFNIDEYNHSELKLIFEKKINDSGWKLKEPLTDEWFKENKTHFKYYGRDMETLFSKVKIAHSKRVFCLPKEEKTKINMKDLEKGFEIYKKMGDNNKIKEEERLKQLFNAMYC